MTESTDSAPMEVMDAVMQMIVSVTDARTLSPEQRKIHREYYAPQVFERIVKQGLSIRETAAQLKLNHQTAANYYKWLLSTLAKEREYIGERIVDLQNVRYNTLLKQWLPMALDENAAPLVRDMATRNVRAIMADQNKLNRIGGYGDAGNDNLPAPQFIFQQLNQTVVVQDTRSDWEREQDKRKKLLYGDGVIEGQLTAGPDSISPAAPGAVPDCDV